MTKLKALAQWLIHTIQRGAHREANTLNYPKRRTWSIVVSSLLLIIVFQNCSKVQFVDEDSKLSTNGAGITEGTNGFLENPDIAASISINGDKKYTNDSNVQLTLKSEGADEMYVTNDSSCEGEGIWEPFKEERGWVLDQTNSTASVYVRYRKNKEAAAPEVSVCAQASIVHDSHPPEVDFISSPEEYSIDSRADFTLAAKDDSGIDGLLCRIDGEAAKKCSEMVFYEGLSEGAHTVYVQAVDGAGNPSKELEHSWIIDRTAPIVTIVDPKPAKKSTTANATFNFEAYDVPAIEGETVMSGISQVICRLNGGTEEPCQSPMMYAELPEGANTFEIYSVDFAGNVSQSDVYSWNVDTQPSGDFKILGVTGGKDNRVDEFLGTQVTPTVHWQASLGTVSYQVSILSLDKKVLCEATAPQSATPNAAMNASKCKLVHGTSYLANVVAFDDYQNPKTTTDFKFTVDTVAPVIKITAPVISLDHKNVTVSFTVEDPVSGVELASCERIFGASGSSQNCMGKPSVNYANLAAGEHEFKISASDRAGNSITSPGTKFLIKKLNLVDADTTVTQPPTKVDVLMVIDNSGSMDKEQNELSARMENLVAALGNLDWQICLTSTDPRDDGQLRKITTDPSAGLLGVLGSSADEYSINKNTAKYEQKLTASVMSFGLKGSGHEQGIYATNQAILRKDSKCFRDDAAMAAIVLSDEDELSVGWNPALSGNNQFKEPGQKNLPTSLNANVASSMGDKKIFTFHSLILKPGDTACHKESGLNYGVRYAEASDLTGGIVGSKCAPNYGTELAEFGKSIIRNLSSINLSCAPYDDNVTVTTTPKISGLKHTLAGNKLSFTPALPPGTKLNMKYACEVP